MRKLLLIPLIVVAFVAASGIYFSGKAPAIAYAQGSVPATIEGWLAEMSPTYLKEQFAHFFKNQDSQTETQKGILEQEKIQAEEAKKQTGIMERMATWLESQCGCTPWKLPKTGGGGGNHRQDPVEATVTPAPTATPDPQCSGTVYRWCEDGNILVTICDGKRLDDVYCGICRDAVDKGGLAYCEAPTATSTPTPGPTPIPPTGTPPPLVKTPNPGCPETPHWVCDGNGNWLWKACGVVLCKTECTLGCSSNPGICNVMVVTPVPVATDTPTPQPWETPVLTNTPPPTIVIYDCRDAAGNLVPCPPTKTPTKMATATPNPWASPSNTSGPGPSATRTPTATATAIVLDCVDGTGKLIPCTPRPPATDLPIATKTPTQVVVPTATLTGPPTITPSGLRCKTDQEVTDDVIVPGFDGYMHILGNELCGFKWNSSRVATTKVRCPRGYMCTLTVAKGSGIEEGVYLIDGDVLGDGWTFVISSGTFRWKNGFPAWDAVWNRCVLLANERAFAFDPRSAHHFEVWPFGFDCGEISLITTDTGLRCPVFGMSDSQTYPLLLEPGTGKCKLPSQPFKRSGNVPDGWLLEAWDGTAVVTLGPGSYWEGFVATVRPQ